MISFSDFQKLDLVVGVAERGANGDAPMSNDFRGHVAHAADMIITIFFTEAQAFGEVCTDHVTVQASNLASMFYQQRC